jgi:hypothetical protein
VPEALIHAPTITMTDRQKNLALRLLGPRYWVGWENLGETFTANGAFTGLTLWRCVRCLRHVQLPFHKYKWRPPAYCPKCCKAAGLNFKQFMGVRKPFLFEIPLHWALTYVYWAWQFFTFDDDYDIGEVLSAAGALMAPHITGMTKLGAFFATAKLQARLERLKRRYHDD